MREVAVSSLESFGYRLLAAESGLAALDVLKGTEPVDLLLVDMAMPGMNGVEVIRRARERHPGCARCSSPVTPTLRRFRRQRATSFSRSRIVWYSWPTASPRRCDARGPNRHQT